jgi:hypothetical protein
MSSGSSSRGSKSKQTATGIRSLHHRVASDGDSLDAIANINVNWVGPRFFLFYALCMAAFEWAVRVALVETLHIFTSSQGWTTVHAVHGIINFLVMHYISGTPSELGDQGEYFQLTWWEQLEDGVPWTTTKKALMLICLVLFLVTAHMTQYELHHLVINLGILVLVIVPKLPLLHRVRLGSGAE